MPFWKGAEEKSAKIHVSSKEWETSAQKEKLHAELKKVLLLKVQKASVEQEPAKMETPIRISEEKLQASEMVEVIVETEAKAGMSGILISGDGKEGVIIRDVVKDSPAAKTLPLLKGDQLLSAHVFFENVKYEDALKILQCVEPYKVSFCLKRAVQSSGFTVSPTSGSVEVKGPKTKMPKMTVKSLTSMKKKKKKEPSQVEGYEDVSLEAHKDSEISVGSMDIPPVDVEFSFPKFSKLIKAKSSVETTTDIKSAEVSTKVPAAEEKRVKIKFPRLRVKDAAAGVKVTSTKASTEVEVKEKEASTFGISVPKIKKPNVDVVAPKTEVELSPPKLEIETKEVKIIKAPQVEIDIPLSSIKAETSDISATESVKMSILSTTARIPDVEIKVPTSQVEVEVETFTGKLSMPQISNIDKCLPSLEKESYVAVEGVSKTEIKLPSVEIAAPKLDDLSLSKAEGKAEAEPSDSGKIFKIKIPHLSLPSKSPEDGLEIKKHVAKKTSEDTFKMPSMKSPEIGVSVSRGKVEGDISEKKVVMKLPSIDISAPEVDFDINIPKGKLDSEISIELDAAGMKVREAYAESPKLKTGKLQTDIETETTESESSFEIPDVTLKMPKIGIPLLGTKAETETPHVEVKTGKITGESPDIKLKGPKMKLPSFGISLSKEKLDLSFPEKDASEKTTETDGKPKIPLIKVPSVDISLPKVPDIQLVKHEVTLPSLKADKKAEMGVGDLQLKMPKVSLPKFDLSAKVEKALGSSPKVEKHDKKTETKIADFDLDTKGDKMTFPKVDISLPKIKAEDLDILSLKADTDISVDQSKLGMKIPKVVYDAIAFNAESKVGIISVKVPDLEIVAPRVDVDLTMPKVKAEASECLSKEPECDLQLPKLNLPKLSDVAKDMAVELDVPKITGDVSSSQFAAHLKGAELEERDVSGTGAKISLPKALLGFGKSTEDRALEITSVEFKEKTDLKIHKVKTEAQTTDAKIKLPSVQLPSVEVTAPIFPDVDIDASIPEVAIEAQSTEDRTAAVPSEKDVKSKSTKFSFHKFGLSGPKIKKGIEVETKTSHLEGETEMPLKGPRMKMPKFGITFPKAKHDLDKDVAKSSKKKADISVCQDDDSSGEKIKLPSVKLPSVDILAPKLEADIGVSKEDVPLVTDKPADISTDIPDVKLNLPKFSLPKFGSKNKGGEMDFEMESSTSGVKLSQPKSSVKVSRGDIDGTTGDKTGKELKTKKPAFKLPSIGISKKETGIADANLEVVLPECKIQKSKEPGKESKIETDSKETDGKTTFIKMPTFKMSPKIKSHDVSLGMKGSKEDLHLPDVHVKVPHVALPSIGIKSDKSADVPLIKSEAKVREWVQEQEICLTEKIKMPSLEVSAPQEIQSLQISLPHVIGDVCTSSPKIEADVSDTLTKAHEGDMNLPKLTTFNVPAPSVKLDISLPKTLEHKPDLALEKSEMKLKIPKVELPKLGEYEQDVSETDGKLKIKMPHVDISLPKIKADEEDIPFIEGELKIHGSDFEVRSKDETFSLPSVELPKMSTPKIRAPELELDISLSKEGDRNAEISSPEGRPSELKFKMPKIKLPKFSGSTDIDDEPAKTDVKTSKTEESTDSGITGFKLKLPKLHVGSLRAKGGDEVSVEMEGKNKIIKKGDTKATDSEDSEDSKGFKIKMPAFGISKESTAACTESLHPAPDGAEVKFKMPKVNIPDVGFSGGEAGGNETTLEKESKSTTVENLEIDLGLKIPKIKMPSFGMSGRKVDDHMSMSLEEDKQANKSLFKVPDLEISTTMKAHAEYDVDGSLEHNLSKEKEIITKKKLSKKIIDELAEEDSGKKYKVKLPKFAINLPKAVQGDIEISAPRLKSEGEESEESLKSLESQIEKKVKKTIFSVGKTKEKNVGLPMPDAGEGDGPEMKMKMPKIKMKPSFGMSRGKAKGNEVNGEFDGSAKEDTDISHDGTTKSSKLKFPKLGFSSNKTNSADVHINGLNGETDATAPNGAQDGMVKIGKIKLPKVEFSSPHKVKETDGEMSLKLVKAEESDSKEEGKENILTTKFKSPKITFSGFKKKDKGEEHQLSSHTRTELATVENIKEGEGKNGKSKISLGFLSGRSKGEYTVDNSGIEKGSVGEAKEKSLKYNLPKLSLSSKAGTEVEVTTETHEIVDESSQEGLKISLPKVAFTAQDEEQTVEEEVTGGILKITKIKQIKTETVTEKTLTL
ncbi:neuroblast differentiation-associated protein AHNAK isoform X2 [Xenopus laevis]|uniref:Neuroblast differentiation-associated protein AHNAK isoform X2 n=1 Tax=Xenopus laevis TaxID=8355 RepID=A0A8J1LPT5_XENLA|nr:neuroblast differentiation-associated protein AHNAK isoform X2 [Xenopus laevis]